jgi:hypothetical protein
MGRGLGGSSRAPRTTALAFALLLAACDQTVALPPEQAAPEVVLDSYLRALLAGDCETGRKLVTLSFKRGNGELCGDTRLLAYRIDPRTARPSPDEIVFSTILTTTGTNDRSIEAGEMIWFYSVSRQPNGFWRLVGGGSGP